MKILVFCDDRWHPARTVRRGLEPLAGDQLQFDWVEDARLWTPDGLVGYPLVILSKSNNVSSTDESEWMSLPVQQALANFVRSGGGLLVIHSGAAGYAETTILRPLLGGVFLYHPEQCPVQVIPREGHPLTSDSQTFTEKDEHYFMEIDDPGLDIFLTTASEHGTQPGGWTRLEGRGRVCVLTPGHNLEVWLNPSYQALIRNSIVWCYQGNANPR